MKFWSVKLGRPDPTLRMRQVVHGLNRVPTRETIGVLSGRLLCEKEIFLRWIVYGLQEKLSCKISWGEFYRSHLH